MVKRSWIAGAAAFLLGSVAIASADDVVRIGVLNDMSGIYSEAAGKGSLVAVQMAAEEFGGQVINKKIDIIGADMQNKADLGANIAREWYERGGVDLIVDAPNSALVLAITKIAAAENKMLIVNAGSSDITGAHCSPNTLHWQIDSYTLANIVTGPLLDKGLDTWFFITADYNFGHAMERDATATIKKRGGKVLGAVRTPLGTTDFSSFVLQAQASGAKVVAFANAGGDAIASIKQATEYGLLKGGQTLVAMDVQVNHLHSLGAKLVEGMYSSEGWYFDMNDASREFSDRFAKRMGRPPSAVQASAYSATRHYLKAVQAAGTDEAGAVLKKMREIPVNDGLFNNGKVREDGRVTYDVLLLQVKSPADVKKDGWDTTNIIKVVPASEAFRPIQDGGCPHVKAN